MRFVGYLLLTSCWCSLWAKGAFSAYTGDEGKLVTEHTMDRSSSERQFMNSLKKWLLGSGGEKKSKETKIKYLPVYIPVPVYSDMKAPAASDFYGAYQINSGESPMIQVPNVATLPYAHSQNYDLPYAGQLHSLPYDSRKSEADIFHQHYYQQLLRNPYAFGGYSYPYGSSYAPPPEYYDREDDGQESEELEPVVIENTSLNNDTIVENDAEDFVRNRRKIAKKNRKGSDYF